MKRLSAANSLHSNRRSAQAFCPFLSNSNHQFANMQIRAHGRGQGRGRNHGLPHQMQAKLPHYYGAARMVAQHDSSILRTPIPARVPQHEIFARHLPGGA